MGDHSLYSRYWRYFIYSNHDSDYSYKMRKRMLLGISLIITALTLLYLLFVNLYRDTFIANDWIVVAVDLSAKVIIESVILLKEKPKIIKQNM